MANYGTTDRCTGGTASANYASQAAALAVDNDAGTYWLGNWNLNWFKYDFGAGITWAISKVTIKSYLHYGVNAFTIEGSNDNSNWTQIYSGNAADNTNVQSFSFPTDNKTKYRYIRINIGSSYDVNSVAEYEIEMFEGIYPAGGGILNWFFSQAWKIHDKLWTPKLILPKEGFSY